MLQTKTYSIGDFAWQSWSNSYVLDLILTEQSVDNLANTSQVDYVLQLRSGDNNRFSDYLDCSLSLAGVEVASERVGIAAYYDYTYTLLSGTTTVKHNADGSLDMAIVASIVEPDGNNKFAPPEMTIADTMALTVIPMASTVGATDSNIGSVSMIAVDQKSAAYTHSIQYRFGSLTGYVTAAGGISATEVKLSATSVPFKVPTDFYAQIPNAESGVCELICRTYSGETQVGEAQTATFIATAAKALCAPTVTGTVTDANDTTAALTGDRTKLIRHKSTALCTISAAAKNSATIVQKVIAGTVIAEGNTLTIPEIERSSVLFSATDSRGYPGSEQKQLSLVPYVKLTNNAAVNRTDPTSGNAVLVLRGDCYTGSFGAVDNVITAKYRVNGGDYINVALAPDGNSYSTEVALSGLDYNSRHTIDVVISDKLSEVPKTVSVKRGIPVFDWGENDFAFNVPVHFKAATYDASTKRLTIS